MPNKPLTSLALNGMGVQGLNTQANASAMEHTWLTRADNTMLDNQGRVTVRKGFNQVSANVGTDSSNTKIFKSLGEFRDRSNGDTIFGAAGDTIYKLETTGDPLTLTAQTFSGTPQTITDGNWQWSNFNGNLFGVQESHLPIIFDGTNWYDLEDFAGFNDPSVTTFNPRAVLGEFGRLWVGGITEAKDVVYYSDTLQGHNFGTGAAGSIDLNTVWEGDEIISLNAFNGQLVIFGRRNIVIYDGADDPDTMVLNEVIEGIGCYARDSVCAMGDDLIFLSNSGVRSLHRTKVQGKVPLVDYSKNIKDDIIEMTISSDKNDIKGQFCLCGGFYVLSFTGINETFVLDFKYPNQDGSPRITRWDFEAVKSPRSYLSTTNGTLYIGKGDADLKGSIGTYDGYYDVDYDDGSSAYVYNTYQAAFKTVWLDFGDISTSKILKRLYAVIHGGAGMVATLNVYKDYSATPKSNTFTIGGVSTPYYWGGAGSLYGAAKYSPLLAPVEYRLPLSGSVKTVQIEMVGTVKGFKASLQSMNINAKIGKIV